MHFAWPHAVALLSFSLASLFAGLGRRLRRALSHLPEEVVRILTDPKHRAELIKIVTTIAAYANLPMEERKKRAVEFVARYLESQGIHLPEHLLNLLVELLYSFVKRHNPGAIAPPPVVWG